MEKSEFNQWREAFLNEVKNNPAISDAEFASFLALVKAFFTARQNTELLLKTVVQAVAKGEVSFGGHKMPLSVDNLRQTSFRDPKWLSILVPIKNKSHEVAQVTSLVETQLSPEEMAMPTLDAIDHYRDYAVRMIDGTVDD